MNRRPPRSTRTDNLFPYTTLFRSFRGAAMRETVGSLTPYNRAISAPDLRPEVTDSAISRRCLSPSLRRIRHLRSQVRRSEEHTSELQSLMRISYAVFCLKKKNNNSSIYQRAT